MKTLFNKLVAEFGLELRTDPIDDSPVACYNGIIVMYLLSSELIDVLYEDGSYYCTSSESRCREWLNEILLFLKQQVIERKIKRMESDFV